MSDRTLPDELRSVLLEHSFDAPDPDDTIARTLADTIETDRIAERPDRPWWRSGAVAWWLRPWSASAPLAGRWSSRPPTTVIPPARVRRPSRTRGRPLKVAAASATSRWARPSDTECRGSAPANPAFLVPTNLSCAATPGGRTVIVFGVPVKLSGVTDQVASAQCSDATGQRNSAQVYTMRTVGGRSTIEATVLRQSDAISVESITGGRTGSPCAFSGWPRPLRARCSRSGPSAR